MQNINSFLAAAEKQFNLKAQELFTADQLYYASDFARVINCLSLLSKTQAAGLAGYKFFPPDIGSVSDRADDGDGEDMYQVSLFCHLFFRPDSLLCLCWYPLSLHTTDSGRLGWAIHKLGGSCG